MATLVELDELDSGVTSEVFFIMLSTDWTWAAVAKQTANESRIPIRHTSEIKVAADVEIPVVGGVGGCRCLKSITELTE